MLSTDLVYVWLVSMATYLQGYNGCAVGKAKQAAKTELEKLKVAEI